MVESGTPGPDDGLNTDGLDDTGVERMIRVTVAAEIADVVSDRFWQHGVRGVSEIDLPDGSVEVSSSVGNETDAIEAVVASFDSAWSWRVDEVSSGPSDAWREHAQATWYRPDLVIVPAWSHDADLSAATVVTAIEPASAFGLGDHPTTRSSMGMLADEIRGGARDVASVLDVGCGTGALAILAAQLGVSTVRAIDIAHAAASATRANAARNGVADTVVVDTSPLADIDERYDIVVANILAPVLVSLADDLKRVVAHDGALIISGILAERHDHVLAALAPLRPTSSIVDDGWITIRLEGISL